MFTLMFLLVPIAKNEDGENYWRNHEDGQEIIIMKGGMGGLGNEHF